MLSSANMFMTKMIDDKIILNQAFHNSEDKIGVNYWAVICRVTACAPFGKGNNQSGFSSLQEGAALNVQVEDVCQKSEVSDPPSEKKAERSRERIGSKGLFYQHSE